LSSAINWCPLPLQRKEGEAAAHLGETVEVRGWVRTVRNQKQFCFMQVGGRRILVSLTTHPSSSSRRRRRRRSKWRSKHRG
jgi:aspartyl/asparaginyl-tRNA synthetase